MGVYLEDNPPKRSQFRRTRRAKVTGAIVIHTAENSPQVSGVDKGAENVARFIAGRSEPGSYHSLVDSDSVVKLVRYDWEAFHEGTGGNRWSLGLSFATRASEWQSLPSRWVDDAIVNGANEARSMANWIKETVGVDVPAERISASQYRSGKPGFVTHAELDPGRRSDPGNTFPWTDFLEQFETSGRPETPDPAPAPTPAPKPVQVESSTPAPVPFVAPIPPQVPKQRGLIGLPYSIALDDIDELYRAYSGKRPPTAERQAIAKDLAKHVFADKKDAFEFVAAVEKRLRDR